MKRNRLAQPQDQLQLAPPEEALLCALNPLLSDADLPPPRSTFGLLVINQALREAIADAYDQLSRGVPGTIELPLALPILGARTDRRHVPDAVPNAGLLKATLAMLELNGGHFRVGAKTSTAFTSLCSAPHRKNAVLQVSRHQAPRIRSAMRGGRHRYISDPLPALEFGSWCLLTPSGKPALSIVSSR